MTDFVDPSVIAQITAAKDELIAEVNKISNDSDVISQYADSLPDPLVGEAPVDGEVYGRKDKDWVKVTQGGGGGGDAVWGGITGTLSDQIDLQTVLDTKVEDADLADVATSGNYTDLIGKPTVIPEAPQDGKQYVRKDAAWAESTLPPLVDIVVEGSFTHKEDNTASAIEAQWYTPSSGSKYGYHFLGNAWGGDRYSFLTDKNGVYHKEDSGSERRLAVFDDITQGGGDTDLGITSNTTSVTITSSTGTDATIPQVDPTVIGGGRAGVMSVADKQKLDSLGAFDGELDVPLKLNGDSSNYTTIAGADTTASGYATTMETYGASNPWSGVTLQYTTKVDPDGIYHTNNGASGSERRLAFIDEVSGGDSGVEEAPEDGKQYARQDAAWTEVVDSGIEEAPEDGKQYARKNAAWSEVVSEGGATTFTELSDTPANYTDASGKVVAVNTAGDGLEFIDAPSGGGDTYVDFNLVDRITISFTNFGSGKDYFIKPEDLTFLKQNKGVSVRANLYTDANYSVPATTDITARLILQPVENAITDPTVYSNLGWEVGDELYFLLEAFLGSSATYGVLRGQDGWSANKLPYVGGVNLRDVTDAYGVPVGENNVPNFIIKYRLRTVKSTGALPYYCFMYEDVVSYP